jgi:hypothetical protein
MTLCASSGLSGPPFGVHYSSQALDRDGALRESLALALELAGCLESDLAPNLALAPARSVAHDFDQALDHVLGRGRDISRDLARELDRALDQARVVAREYVFEQGCLIMNPELVSIERSALYIEASNALDRYRKNRVSSPRAVLREIETALDFPRLAHGFTQAEARQCVEFLTGTRRIIECREAAERATQAGWDCVCGRLIAVPRPDQI